MNFELLCAIVAVCKESEIDLRLSDIVSYKRTEDSVVMHCRNEKEMFEFFIRANKSSDKYAVKIIQAVDSVFPCDDMLITLNRAFDIIEVIHLS